MVWPKSGCATKSATTMMSSASAIELAGISGRAEVSPNSHAISTTNAGFMNSDGWILTPRMTSQRRAPLISAPKCGVAAIRMTLTTKTSSATLRMSCGERNEVAIITAMAGMRKKICRLTKWNGSRPMRAATGGLAARHRMMPASISAHERRQGRPVDRPPPFGKRRRLRARSHHVPGQTGQVVPGLVVTLGWFTGD